jgi:hypothetical protein
MNDLPPLPSSATPPKSGLSTTSLILGVLSIVPCSIFAGVPAIITGHIAHSRAKKQPELYGGAGTALAGLIMGYVSLGLTVLMIPLLAALMLPALAKAKVRAQTISCVNNMKQIGLAGRIWANGHSDAFPPNFISMSNELVAPKILVCPGDKTKTVASSWQGFDQNLNVTYEFVTPNAKENEPQTVVFRCPVHGNIGLADGSVQQVPGGQRGR